MGKKRIEVIRKIEDAKIRKVRKNLLIIEISIIGHLL